MLQKVKEELLVLKLVSTHPRLPRRCKILAVFLVAYALSPIDLIPDFIPVLGQLDDLVILPVGLWALYRMVPAEIMEEARSAAKESVRNKKPEHVNQPGGCGTIISSITCAGFNNSDRSVIWSHANCEIMAGWISELLGFIGFLVKLYCVFLVFCLLGMAYILVTAVGDQTLVDETIHLSPGETKSYYLPPGMTYVHVNSDVPINENEDGLTSHGGSYGTTVSDGGMGTPFGVNCTFSNPEKIDATVNVHISTGVLNLFGYALYGI